MTDIDCIIVGKNCSATLKACVESVQAASYTRGHIHLYYLDQGSKDNSIEIARGLGLTVVEDRKAGTSPLIQYLSADVTLDENWFGRATKVMASDIDALRGRVEFSDPKKDRYHWISYLEVNAPYGDLKTMEGDCLARREPKKGRSVMLNESMSFGVAAITRWDQWWSWARHLPSNRTEVLWRGGGCILFVILAIIGMAWVFWWIALLLPAAFLLLYPRIFEVDQYAKAYQISSKEAAVFAWHRSLAAIPQLLTYR